MKINVLLAVFALALMTVGCSENSRAKAFGGTMNVEIPADQTFVNVTWKEASLWILTKDRTATDMDYSTYHFTEDSTGGWFEGEVVIKHLKPDRTN